MYPTIREAKAAETAIQVGELLFSREYATTKEVLP
jgi:hypothetical protein